MQPHPTRTRHAHQAHQHQEVAERRFAPAAHQSAAVQDRAAMTQRGEAEPEQHQVLAPLEVADVARHAYRIPHRAAPWGFKPTHRLT